MAQLPFVRDAMTSGAKEKGVGDKNIFDEDLLASKPCSGTRESLVTASRHNLTYSI